MNTRDQFGNYLLLKKLTEDALGETFRAGRIGRQTLDRVVLLRVYNGQGLDSERIAKTIQARGGLAAALKSPNVASAIDSGQVRGVPYVAYDYVSGRTLSQLAEQALRRGQPVPLDHALLIAERIASGLAVACETRFGDDRVSHGVLTPHEVWVSHEGELRIAGFEAAPGVRESCGHPVLKQALGRYLAPEALAGQPAAKSDDVYSVAAILLELLTAQPVPAMPAGGFGALVEQAVVAADGGNLHPDVTALLQRSLCPRDQRVGDAVTWHKTLAKLMAEGQYNPTTFNLAFFLHNLFRDEIERETQELETERTQALQIPAQAEPSRPEPAGEVLSPLSAASAPPPASMEAPSGAGTGAVQENTDVLREMYGISDRKKAGKGGLIAAIVGGAAIVLGVGGYFLFFRNAPGAGTAAPEETPPAAAAPVEAAPAEPAEPVETGPSPDEIQAQIAQMVEEQSKQLEAGLKQKYDEQLQALQRQLEDARKTEDSRPTPPPEPRPAETAPATRPTPAGQPPTQQQATPPASSTTAQPEPAQTTAQQSAPTEPPPAATRPAPKPPEPKPAPTVKLGDLVEPGPGVVPPRIVRKPVLRYPPVAQRMRKEATVTVSVLIDHTGRVVEVKQIGPKAGFGLDEAAADYAREISWAPASKEGVKVKMWYDLRVAFTLGGG